MKAVILDDEPLAIEGMKRMLDELGVDVCGAYYNPLEALAEIAGTKADVVFVDMEMPGMSGLEAARQFQTLLPGVQIVFVTAHDQYAVEAFEQEAVDYLLKPVHGERLEKTMNRLKRKLDGASGIKGAAGLHAAVLCCFHHTCIESAGGRVNELAWRTAKAKELFSYLLHKRHMAVPRDVIIELLWPELEIAKAQTHLHTTIYQIRQTLKAANIPVQIVYLDGGYRMELSGIPVDVELWEKDPRRLYWYRGDYFEMEGYWWAEQERERLRLLWLETALAESKAMAESGEIHDAISLLQQVRQRLPLRKESYFKLIELYAQIGQHNEAKNTFNQLNEVLWEETGERLDGTAEDWMLRRGIQP